MGHSCPQTRQKTPVHRLKTLRTVCGALGISKPGPTDTMAAVREPSGEDLDLMDVESEASLNEAAGELDSVDDIWQDVADTVFAAMGDYGWMPRTMHSAGFVQDLSELIEEYFVNGDDSYAPSSDSETEDDEQFPIDTDE